MAGIVSYGTYIPRYRLGKETTGWGLPIEKPVTNFDEDSITMAVAAGRDCISGLDSKAVDALHFATTTSPYIEKQGAATVATAVDLRRNILTSDSTNSLRAGTLALRSALDAIIAGSAKQVLVTAADCRLGAPQSTLDQVSGAGAAALLLGSNGVIANVIDSYSISEEIIDVWRAEGDNFVRSWEDRFALETGYLRVLPEAISGLLEKCKLTPKDITKAAFYAPDARRHSEVAKKLGFDQSQIQDPLFGKVGNIGAAFAPMLLVAALEEAKPGDKILLASYGDGADAYLLEVTDEITKLGPRRGVKRNLESKRILDNYNTYLKWRGLLASEGARRPPVPPPSAPAHWRERDDIDRLHGAKCKTCEQIQYPPQRVCAKCHTKDNWETVTLADKKAKIFTFSLDYIAGTVDVPLAIVVVNFEGGGRGLFEMTDRELDEVKCEAPVEMGFRKLRSSGGVHNYFWKAIPPRV